MDMDFLFRELGLRCLEPDEACAVAVQVMKEHGVEGVKAVYRKTRSRVCSPAEGTGGSWAMDAESVAYALSFRGRILTLDMHEDWSSVLLGQHRSFCQGSPLQAGQERRTFFFLPAAARRRLCAR